MSKTKQRKWKMPIVLVLVLSFVMALTGCIQFEMSTTVNRDGTVDIHILYATIDMSSMSDDSSSGSMDTTGSIETTRQNLEAIGWKTKEYKNNINGTDYIGFECAKNGINIDDIESEIKQASDKGLGISGFTLKKDGDKYIFNWDISSSNSDLESQGLDASTIAGYGGYMKISLSAPNGTLSNNATTVSADGKTLEWDLFSCTESPHAEFTLDVVDDDDDEDDEDEDDEDEDDEDEDEDDDEDSGKKSKKSKNSKKSDSDDDGMPVWVIGLIIGGSVLVVAAVVVIIIVVVKKKKNGDSTAA
ncbi:MAG: hypothetical protein J5636_06595 [Clostridiales bacterium]|nr:hypothetical protein [Clostridiales bacterium]